jgi:hypothetical protein
MKRHWTRYGWVNEYTKEEIEKLKKQNEEAKKNYVYPTPPNKEGKP